MVWVVRIVVLAPWVDPAVLFAVRSFDRFVGRFFDRDRSRSALLRGNRGRGELVDSTGARLESNPALPTVPLRTDRRFVADDVE